MQEDEQSGGLIGIRDDDLCRGVDVDPVAPDLDVLEISAVTGALVGWTDAELEERERYQREDQQRRDAAPPDRAAPRSRDGWG
jgi:hypothetical protein